MEEDQSLRFSRDPQTKEFLLSGSGQQHIEVVVARMRKRFKVEVLLKPPKVAYRETIRGKADAEGKHKKQTGGHGQYGVCRVRMEPMERGAGFEFVDDVFGGAIPNNFIPSVEKGIRAAAERGFLAGFPMVDFRAVLYDGKYHDVDSSDMAFKIAGSLAFKECMKQAKPALLEPVMRVECLRSGPILRVTSWVIWSFPPRSDQWQPGSGIECGDQGPGAVFRDVELCHGFDGHDPGSGQLLDGDTHTMTSCPMRLPRK